MSSLASEIRDLPRNGLRSCQGMAPLGSTDALPASALQGVVFSSRTEQLLPGNPWLLDVEAWANAQGRGALPLSSWLFGRPSRSQAAHRSASFPQSVLRGGSPATAKPPSPGLLAVATRPGGSSSRKEPGVQWNESQRALAPGVILEFGGRVGSCALCKDRRNGRRSTKTISTTDQASERTLFELKVPSHNVC